ncbi:hypothetical protein [Amycolatopsis sp. VC5-11]|uniref:hypothetical protein n=1 Tax=Amycolatopsis sp. VC5-11 TaxID=3120156 RepID=UPI003008D700
MSALAQLFFGIAALVTALLSGVAGIIAVVRVPKRAAEKAAEIAVARTLGDDDDDEDQKEEILDAVRKLLEEKARDGEDE